MKSGVIIRKSVFVVHSCAVKLFDKYVKEKKK